MPFFKSNKSNENEFLALITSFLLILKYPAYTSQYRELNFSELHAHLKEVSTSASIKLFISNISFSLCPKLNLLILFNPDQVSVKIHFLRYLLITNIYKS